MTGIKVFDDKPEITAKEIKDALQTCTAQILKNLPEFTYSFPKPNSEKLFYEPAKDNGDWTTGFWTGEIWLAMNLVRMND